MGNALRALRKLCSSLPLEVPDHSAGCAALAQDLADFEATGQVPEGLSAYVTSKKKAQAVWYGKLLAAWQAAAPPPSNVHEASTFVVETLRGHRKADVQGLLLFYDLTPKEAGQVAPSLADSIQTLSTPYPHPQVPIDSWPQGVQYELRTLPVQAKSITDGDTLVVYVDVNKNLREKALVPNTILEALAERRAARKIHDYSKADALEKKFDQAGYKVFDSKDGDILAHKYRVRLRGVDAPESHMPYGQEAKATFLSLVENQQLSILVYNQDQYGRLVADVHSSQGFIQETLLKKGCAWHYIAYDKRPDFSKWEQQAKAAHRGLWAVSNPQKPWEYRKEHRK